jgi:hypothetical protein
MRGLATYLPPGTPSNGEAITDCVNAADHHLELTPGQVLVVGIAAIEFGAKGPFRAGIAEQ